jgi:mono/diheme cytochrome c family protein
MNRNKHLLLWSSLGVLGLLVVAWAQENVFREWRDIQSGAVSASGPVEVRLRQVSVPGLHATDRCVSCHVAMAPGEMGVSGGAALKEHPKLPHDPSDFGCTVCHGGQGRATEKADAHGRVPHWPEPMLTRGHEYAGCGSCHTHLRVPGQNVLEHGLALVERHDCLACHGMDGRGGTLRPGATTGSAAVPGGKAGTEAGATGSAPDLSRIGAAGYDPAWYEKHLKQSRAAVDGPWKTSFGVIDDAGRQALESYLLSRVGAPQLVAAKSLFHSLGCRGCHKVGGVGGDDGPDLTLTGQKDPALLDFSHVPGEHTLANWHAEHLRAPARIVPGSQMPAFGLSEDQVQALTLYLVSLRRSSYPEAYWPKDRVRAARLGEREFATDGATLYGTFCAACHGTKGEGMRYAGMPFFPAVGKPDFLAVASDEFIAATITHGRAGRRMPAWGEKVGGLRPEEIASVVGHLRTLSGVAAPAPDTKPQRWARGDLMLGAYLYGTQCAACHGSTGEAPLLTNKALLGVATDTYLVETIKRGRRGTVMKSFGQPSPIHPTLSQEEVEAIVAFLRSREKS